MTPSSLPSSVPLLIPVPQLHVGNFPEAADVECWSRLARIHLHQQDFEVRAACLWQMLRFN